MSGLNLEDESNMIRRNVIQRYTVTSKKARTPTGKLAIMVIFNVHCRGYQNYGRDEHFGVTRPISRAVNSRNNMNVITKMTGSTGWGSVHSALLKIHQSTAVY